jgi:hypothetical protein
MMDDPEPEYEPEPEPTPKRDMAPQLVPKVKKPK